MGPNRPRIHSFPPFVARFRWCHIWGELSIRFGSSPSAPVFVLVFFLVASAALRALPLAPSKSPIHQRKAFSPYAIRASIGRQWNQSAWAREQVQIRRVEFPTRIDPDGSLP